MDISILWISRLSTSEDVHHDSFKTCQQSVRLMTVRRIDFFKQQADVYNHNKSHVYIYIHLLIHICMNCFALRCRMSDSMILCAQSVSKL